jgi:hypothetical protein
MVRIAAAFILPLAAAVPIHSATAARILYLDAAAPGANPSTVWEDQSPSGHDFSNSGAIHNDLAGTNDDHYAFGAGDRMDGTGNESLFDFDHSGPGGTGATPFTINAYFKQNWIGGDVLTLALVTKTDEPGNGLFRGFVMQGNSDSSTRFDFFTQPGNNTQRLYVRTNAGASFARIMYTVTFDGSGTFAGTKVYVNGLPVSTAQIANALNGSMLNDNPMKLGAANVFDANNGWQGELYFVEIYDEVLSAQAVADRFDQIGGGGDPGPMPTPADLLDTNVTAGTIFNVPSHPSSQRDCDFSGNTVAAETPLMNSRKAIVGGAFQTAEANWMTTQNPTADLPTIAGLVSNRYQQLVGVNVLKPTAVSTGITYRTLIYPTNYHNNPAPVTVRIRRFTFTATDFNGDTRTLAAYYANYDKLGEHDGSVILQINGHFGSSPTWQAFGMSANGGFSGAALGKIAMQGYPLIAYDDHDVGESSAATGTENGLHRTLANLLQMEEAILQYFDRVDGLGLSGGTERLYHYLILHTVNLQSAYLAGFSVAPWTRLDAAFGSDQDTHNFTYLNNFQWADMVLVGLHRGLPLAMTHNANEGSRSKYGLHVETVPSLLNHVGPEDFELRGGDANGDGIRDNGGTELCHEFDLPDYYRFLRKVRADAPAWPWIAMDHGVEIYWYTEDNETYQVQWADGLLPAPVWQNLGGQVTDQEEIIRVPDASPTADSKIYRVIRP